MLIPPTLHPLPPADPSQLLSRHANYVLQARCMQQHSNYDAGKDHGRGNKAAWGGGWAALQQKIKGHRQSAKKEGVSSVAGKEARRT
eukprot:1150569-Pelagomonas_calceolata.AAC.1